MIPRFFRHGPFPFYSIEFHLRARRNLAIPSFSLFKFIGKVNFVALYTTPFTRNVCIICTRSELASLAHSLHMRSIDYRRITETL